MFFFRSTGCSVRLVITYSLRPLLVLVLLLIMILQVQGQADPEPRLFLNTLGPAAEVRTLAFSNDSTKLYAAGLDKAIHVWDVGWNAVGADRASSPRLTYVRSIRWEFARGQRGTVNCLAVNPASNEMAVGGYSMRVQTGDIALVDLDLNEVVASLPKPAERLTGSRTKQPLQFGHLETLISVDYAPSGNQLVTTDLRNHILLWNRQPDGSWKPRTIKAPDPEDAVFPFPAIFDTESSLLVPRLVGRNVYQLERLNLNGNRTLAAPEQLPLRIADLTRGADGSWAIADGEGRFYVTPALDPQNRWSGSSKFENILSMRLGRDGVLAVVSCETLTKSDGRSAVELWDTQQRQRMDSTVLSQIQKVRDVAISPDGRFLATVNEDQRAVVVYQLQDEAGVRLAKPLSGRQPLVAHGSSLAIKSVQVDSEANQIRFGTERDRFSHSLRIDNIEVLRSEGAGREFWRRRFPNWDVSSRQQITTNSNSASNVEIRKDGQQVASVSLHYTLQGMFSAACLIGSQESNEPTAVAIATDNSCGIFVYELVRNGRPKLVRWFYDHNQTATSLDYDPKTNMIVSGSMDGTVKFWSLRGAFQADPEFNKSTFWGASFVVRNNALLIQRVDPNGIAAARGLRDGDQVVAVQGVSTQDWPKSLAGETPPSNGQQLLSILQQHTVLEQARIIAQRADGEIDVVIRPGWEPVLTLFVNERDEWAIWHPRGFFNASAAEGGELFGWQLNEGQDRPVRILAADQLQKDLERPAVIQQLLRGLPFEQAIAQTGEQFLPIQEIARVLPEVKIITPTQLTQAAVGQDQSIVARVRFDDADRQAYAVTAAIDAFRLGPPQREQQTADGWLFTWNARLPEKLNQIQIMVTEQGGALQSRYATDTLVVRSTPTKSPSYRMHLLTVACENYDGTSASERGSFGPLQFPIDDVQAVAAQLLDSQLKRRASFEVAAEIAVTDDLQPVTREAVVSAIEKINSAISKEQTAERRDVLIVYLAGHGISIDGQFYYVTPQVRSGDPEEIRRGGVPWTVFEQAGAKNCQVIYMLDTCHSGTVSDLARIDNRFMPISEDRKAAIRNPKRSLGIVFAASTGTAPAFEDPDKEHGLFSHFVIEALRGKADTSELPTSGNQQVELSELLEFVTKEVKRETRSKQLPSYTPSKLVETIDIPLVKVPASQ